jgi:preprotein translocase subunit YajC
VGDEVLTQAGFIARVKDIRVPPEDPTEIVLELGPGLEVRAYATAIVQKLGQKPDAAPSSEGASRHEAKGKR